MYFSMIIQLHEFKGGYTNVVVKLVFLFDNPIL